MPPAVRLEKSSPGRKPWVSLLRMARAPSGATRYRGDCMKPSRIGLAILLLTLTAAAQPKPTPATVIARSKAGKVTLEFEGKQIPGDGVLKKLEKLHASHNISRLDVLASPDLRLADVYDLESAAVKVGFTKYRVFAVDRGQKRLIPLQWGQEQLFTLSPK